MKEPKAISTTDTDALTGLLNREGFEKEVNALRKAQPDTEFCIIYWNIKEFKIANILLGRERCDWILKNISNVFRKFSGQYPIVFGRIISDRFVCCIPKELVEIIDWKNATDIKTDIHGFEYHLHSNYGIYYITKETLSVDEMIMRAQIAMQTFSSPMTQSYAVYNQEMGDRAIRRNLLLGDFRRALESGQFYPVYQPICDAGTGHVISVEVLTRWKHPVYGNIPPAEFFPLFEENGCIGELDRYIWEKACQTVRTSFEHSHKVVPFSINVSKVDFLASNLADIIYDIVIENGLNPEFIQIEITESACTFSKESVQRTVQKLHDCGFKILMDDFGKECSSFEMLSELPIDILKIDTSFIQNHDKTKKDKVIMDTLVRLARELELESVIEGVETEEQARYVQKIGGNYVQGYYYYKPMLDEQILHLLDASR